MEISLIESIEDLEFARSGILKLFSDAYGTDLPQELWEWAFLNTSYGKPIVAVARDKSEIVGHYGMIPMPFLINGVRTTGYLSMTTMVAAGYRGRGLFGTLAQFVYEAAPRDSFVYGFPNSQSIKGFEKHLAWKMNMSCSLINIDTRKLLDYKGIFENQSKKSTFLNVRERNFLAWRLSKPGIYYEKSNDLIYKRYKDSIDLVYFSNFHDTGFFADYNTVNFMTSNEELKSLANSITSYPLGYKEFSAHLQNLDFNLTMLMSDVF